MKYLNKGSKARSEVSETLSMQIGNTIQSNVSNVNNTNNNLFRLSNITLVEHEMSVVFFYNISEKASPEDSQSFLPLVVGCL